MGIIGLFCENAVRTGQEYERMSKQRQDEHRQAVLTKLMVLFRSMDTDNSGFLTKGEYLAAISENGKVAEILTELGLADEETLFDCLDTEGIGQVSFDQFVDGVTLLMKGHDEVQAKDLVATHLTVQAMRKRSRRIDNKLTFMSEETNSSMRELLSRLAELEHEQASGQTGTHGRVTNSHAVNVHGNALLEDINQRVYALEASAGRQRNEFGALQDKINRASKDIAFIVDEVKNAKYRKRDERRRTDKLKDIAYARAA